MRGIGVLLHHTLARPSDYSLARLPRIGMANQTELIVLKVFLNYARIDRPRAVYHTEYVPGSVTDAAETRVPILIWPVRFRA